MIDAGRTVKLTRADEQRAEKLYGRKWRQIRRWEEKGRKLGDPCPLFEPEKMPGWWTRTSSWRVPAEIEQAAINVRSGGIAVAAEKITPAGAQPSPPPLTSIDITQLQLDEGQAVTQQRQIVAALYVQLNQAYLLGNPTDLIQSRYLKAGQALRQLEKDDREDKAHRGKFLPRDIIERDAALLTDMLRQMRESMVRRVNERCPSLTPAQRTEVAEAVQYVRAQEERIFIGLESLTNPEDLLAALAA